MQNAGSGGGGGLTQMMLEYMMQIPPDQRQAALAYYNPNSPSYWEGQPPADEALPPGGFEAGVVRHPRRVMRDSPIPPSAPQPPVVPGTMLDRPAVSDSTGRVQIARDPTGQARLGGANTLGNYSALGRAGSIPVGAYNPAAPGGTDTFSRAQTSFPNDAPMPPLPQEPSRYTSPGTTGGAIPTDPATQAGLGGVNTLGNYSALGRSGSIPVGAYNPAAPGVGDAFSAAQTTIPGDGIMELLMAAGANDPSSPFYRYYSMPQGDQWYEGQDPAMGGVPGGDYQSRVSPVGMQRGAAEIPTMQPNFAQDLWGFWR